MAFQEKKFLDAEGVTHLVKLLDEYPNNQILGSVIDAIEGELTQKYEKPVSGIPASDLASGVIPTIPVQDVQINGTSAVQNGVANVPVAGNDVNTFGVVSGNTYAGIVVGANGRLATQRAQTNEIKTGKEVYRPLVPDYQHYSTFYGLAKAAGHDEKDSAESFGTYTSEAKGAIQSMLGVSDLIAPAENNLVASKAYAIGDIFTAKGKLYKATAAIAQDAAIIPTVTGEEVSGANCVETNLANENIKDVQINGTSVLQSGVANVPIASTTNFGVVKLPGTNYGIGKMPGGEIYVAVAVDYDVKSGTQGYKPITPITQHASTFYGLAKAAGVDMAQSSNAIGTYTTEAKAAIQTMLDVPSTSDIPDVPVQDVQVSSASIVDQNGVANIPVARTGVKGVSAIDIDFGIGINVEDKLYINRAELTQIKAGANKYRPIVPNEQHLSTFYGLAKVAGADMASSSNEVGTYTTEAKAAIQAMLGIDLSSIASQVEIPLVETVSGAAVTITGQPNTRYMCGEVTSISITPPAAGSIDVVFTSGSTVAVLTLPSTVKMPEWFDASTLDTNTVYEILITDGVYGSVMTWAT